jgi:hypothetical protein
MLGIALSSTLVLRLSENGLRSKRRSLLALICAVALGTPANARAAPSADLAEQALKLDQQGRYAEAAALWERKAAEDEGEERLVSILHAADAWTAAHAATGDVAHHCAAEALVARTLAEEALDRRSRADFMSMFEALREKGIECGSHEQASADEPDRAEEAAVPASRSSQPQSTDDRPRAELSPGAIVGATALSLAAPLVGGTVYALIDDAAVARELDTYTRRVESGGSLSDTERLRVEELGERAIRDRNVAIGLGISGAVLTGLGLGMLLRGRRSQTRQPSQLSLQPRLGRDAAGLTLNGRF